MVDGADRHADRATLIVARERSKAGHALDHRALSAFCRRPFGPESRFASARFEQLHLVQPRVDAVGPRHQLVVLADLDDAAAFEHDDGVGALHGREAVRDHERRAVEHQRGQRVLHQPLRLGIERRGRLVEDQDRRVLQQRPRNRQPLALPAREPLAALADRGLVAVRAARR